jgi:Uma2 family endonuclease
MAITEEDLENNFKRFRTNKILSEEDFLIREASAEIRSEYEEGRVTLFSQKSLAHNDIVMNIFFELYQDKVEERQIFLRTLLVHLPKCKSYFYPDISIVFGKPEIRRLTKDGLDALVNPQTIVEVMDKETVGNDLGKKMKCYLELKSLKEYIVVSSEEKLIIIYTKNATGEIRTKIYDEKDKEVKIGSCKITMDRIYRKVGFDVEENEIEEEKS